MLEPRSKPAHPLKNRIIDSQYRFDTRSGNFHIEFKKYAEGVAPKSNLKRTRPEGVQEKKVRPVSHNRRLGKEKPKQNSPRANLQRTVTGVPTLSSGNFEEIYGGLNKWFFPEETRPLVANWYGPRNMFGHLRRTQNAGLGDAIHFVRREFGKGPFEYLRKLQNIFRTEAVQASAEYAKFSEKEQRMSVLTVDHIQHDIFLSDRGLPGKEWRMDMLYVDMFRKVALRVNDICSGVTECHASLMMNPFFQLYIEEEESIFEDYCDRTECPPDPMPRPVALWKWEPTRKKCAARRKRHVARKRARVAAEMKMFLEIIHEHEMILADLLYEHMKQFTEPKENHPSGEQDVSSSQKMRPTMDKVMTKSRSLLTPAGGVGQKRKGRPASPKEATAVSPTSSARRVSARLQGQPPQPRSSILVTDKNAKPGVSFATEDTDEISEDGDVEDPSENETEPEELSDEDNDIEATLPKKLSEARAVLKYLTENKIFAAQGKTYSGSPASKQETSANRTVASKVKIDPYLPKDQRKLSDFLNDFTSMSEGLEFEARLQQLLAAVVKVPHIRDLIYIFRKRFRTEKCSDWNKLVMELITYSVGPRHILTFRKKFDTSTQKEGENLLKFWIRINKEAAEYEEVSKEDLSFRTVFERFKLGVKSSLMKAFINDWDFTASPDDLGFMGASTYLQRLTGNWKKGVVKKRSEKGVFSQSQ